MKNKQNRKFPTALVVAAIVVLLALSVTFAGIFSNTVSISGLMSLSNFKASSDVYFDGVADMTAYTETDGSVRVSLNDADPNYIGKLRVDVTYAGCGVSLVRVRMIEQWSTESDGVRLVKPFSIKVPYLVDDYADSTGNAQKWLDNRENDYRFYYATPVHNTGDAERSIPLVQGIDFDTFDIEAIPEGTQLHIVAETDVVQVNRYPQYWGLTQLPWTDGVSATEEALS